MEINFKNDVLFKYALSNDKDHGCLLLLDLIIRDLIGINYTSLSVLNPDIIPEKILDKEIVLDVLIQDVQGRKIDIEMQKSSLLLYLYQRFQFYGAKLLTTQLNEGDTYDNLHAVYQVIFIDDINYVHPCLKEVYTSRTDTAIEEKNNLIHRIYVFLPYINEIKKQKPLQQFTSLEKMIYIFANSIDNDIIKVSDKVVEVMDQKAKRFNREEALAHYALQRQLGHWVHEGEKREKYQEGLEEGKKAGIALGKEKGILIGKETAQLKMVQLLLKNKFPNESLLFLNQCTADQINYIVEHIFDNISYKQLKEQLSME